MKIPHLDDFPISSSVKLREFPVTSDQSGIRHSGVPIRPIRVLSEFFQAEGIVQILTGSYRWDDGSSSLAHGVVTVVYLIDGSLDNNK